MNRYVLMGAVLVAAVGYGYFQDNPELLGGLNTAEPETQKTEDFDDGRDDITSLKPGNPDMDAAYAETQKYLDKFISRFRESGDNQSDFTVKVAFPVIIDGEESDEIVWTTGLEDLGDGNFAAILDGEPEWMEGLQYQDRVEFTDDMIRDWALNAGQRYYGHFTTRVLRAYVSADEVEMIDSILMPDPVPPSFND